MKRFKKFIKYLGIVIILIILFRGLIYRASVNYLKIKTRPNIKLTNKKLIEEINEQTENKTLSIEEIIKLSNRLTSKNLDFTFDKISNNPNVIYELKQANCIGYSSLFNSIGNHIVRKQKLTDKYEFVHLVGELSIFGFNVHDLIDSPFFKDHDYNKVKDKQTGKTKFIDPSLRDYVRIESVTSE